jgi:hypothetical protein
MKPTRKAHVQAEPKLTLHELNMRVFLNQMTKSKAIDYLVEHYNYRREFARWLVFMHWGRP